MKKKYRIYFLLSFLIFIIISCAQTIPDPNLVEQIAKIKAIDNHSHMLPATANQGFEHSFSPILTVARNRSTENGSVSKAFFTTSRNWDFELKNGSGFWGRGFIAGARYEHTTYQIFMSGSAWPTIDKSLVKVFEVIRNLLDFSLLHSRDSTDFSLAWQHSGGYNHISCEAFQKH